MVIKLTRLALIPDSTLIKKIIDCHTKTNQIRILLHDQLHISIYKELSQEEKGNDIGKLQSFGTRTSANQTK
ncbi:87_t:CDS:1, partial [Entrophospora sp. SA101]